MQQRKTEIRKLEPREKGDAYERKKRRHRAEHLSMEAASLSPVRSICSARPMPSTARRDAPATRADDVIQHNSNTIEPTKTRGTEQ
jgi:hypothetical protein